MFPLKMKVKDHVQSLEVGYQDPNMKQIIMKFIHANVRRTSK